MSWRSMDSTGENNMKGEEGGRLGRSGSNMETDARTQQQQQQQQPKPSKRSFPPFPLTRVGPTIEMDSVTGGGGATTTPLPLLTTGPPGPAPLPLPLSSPMHAARSALVKLIESLQIASSLFPHDGKESMSPSSWMKRQGNRFMLEGNFPVDGVLLQEGGATNKGSEDDAKRAAAKEAIRSEMKLLEYTLRTALADAQRKGLTKAEDNAVGNQSSPQHHHRKSDTKMITTSSSSSTSSSSMTTAAASHKAAAVETDQCISSNRSDRNISLSNRDSNSDDEEGGGMVTETSQAVAGFLHKILQTLQDEKAGEGDLSLATTRGSTGSDQGQPRRGGGSNGSSTASSSSPPFSSSIITNDSPVDSISSLSMNGPLTSGSSSNGSNSAEHLDSLAGGGGGGAANPSSITSLPSSSSNQLEGGEGEIKILLVIRSAETALRLTMKAKEQGLICHTTRSALRALADVSDGSTYSQDYQTVVVEADFPVMGGLEFVSRLRRDGGPRWHSRLVILVRNGAECPGFEDAARRAGATEAIETWDQINFASLRQVLSQRGGQPPPLQPALRISLPASANQAGSGPMGSATWVHGNTMLGTLAVNGSVGTSETSPETSQGNGDDVDSTSSEGGGGGSGSARTGSTNGGGGPGHKRTKRACSFCHAKKVLCTGERPCARCAHQGIECKEYQPKPRLGKRQQNQPPKNKKSRTASSAAGAPATAMLGVPAATSMTGLYSNNSSSNNGGGSSSGSEKGFVSGAAGGGGGGGGGVNASPIMAKFPWIGKMMEGNQPSPVPLVSVPPPPAPSQQPKTTVGGGEAFVQSNGLTPRLLQQGIVALPRYITMENGISNLSPVHSPHHHHHQAKRGGAHHQPHQQASPSAAAIMRNLPHSSLGHGQSLLASSSSATAAAPTTAPLVLTKDMEDGLGELGLGLTSGQEDPSASYLRAYLLQNPDLYAAYIKAQKEKDAAIKQHMMNGHPHHHPHQMVHHHQQQPHHPPHPLPIQPAVANPMDWQRQPQQHQPKQLGPPSTNACPPYGVMEERPHAQHVPTRI